MVLTKRFELLPPGRLVSKTRAYTVPPDQHVLVEEPRIELELSGCKPVVQPTITTPPFYGDRIAVPSPDCLPEPSLLLGVYKRRPRNKKINNNTTKMISSMSTSPP